MLIQKDLQGIVWNDISIQQLNEHDKLLVFICENNEQAKKLYKILSVTNCDIRVRFDNDKNCIIELYFIDDEFGLILKTDRQEDWYYPIGWLRSNLVNYFTAGHWLDEHQTYMYKPFLKLIRPAQFLN